MKDSATLLYEWRQVRLQLKEQFCESNLQKAIDFWKNINHHRHGFNYDHMDTWPDVWQYITEGFYTNSGNGLACFYTVYHANPKTNPEVWLIHDLEHGDMYLVCYVNGYILNRISGKLEKLEDIKDDISILEKHSCDTVIENIKFRNE